MLDRLLKYNYSTVVITGLLVLIKLLCYFTGQTDSGNYVFSLFNIFTEASILNAVLAVIVAVLLGILILFNGEHHAKCSDFSYWLVLIFALQLSFYPFFAITVEYIGLFCFVLALLFVSKDLSKTDHPKPSIDSFNLAFFLSIGTLFTPHLIYTLPLFGLCNVFLGNCSLRSFITFIIGYTLPFVITDTIIFIFFSDIAEYTHRFVLDQLTQEHFISLIKFNSWEQLSIIGPALFLFFSLFRVFVNAYTMKTVIRKYNTINLVMLVYISLTILLGIIPAHFGVMLLFVPTSYFYTNFLSTTTLKGQKFFVLIFVVSLVLSYPPTIKGIISLYQVIF